MKRKTRKAKEEEYEKKYSHIPIDFNERLSWLYDELKITDTQAYEILHQRDLMLSSLSYYDAMIVLYEVPEGTPRPRFRIVNRKNLSNMAMANSEFVHVYSLTGHEDQVFMKRLMTEEEFKGLDNMICTPCVVDICTYFKTPSYFNKTQTILAEIGLERPITKPDWDNLEKRYSDMFNANIWLDDTLVIDGSIHRFYSVLPRVEIRLRYLNMLYNNHQYRSITNRTDYDESYAVDYFKG